MNKDEIARNKRLQEQQQNKPQIPSAYDMTGIIEYLHKRSGRIPTESECLRFHIFLTTFAGEPTEKECTDFLRLLGIV